MKTKQILKKRKRMNNNCPTRVIIVYGEDSSNRLDACKEIKSVLKDNVNKIDCFIVSPLSYLEFLYKKNMPVIEMEKICFDRILDVANKQNSQCGNVSRVLIVNGFQDVKSNYIRLIRNVFKRISWNILVMNYNKVPECKIKTLLTDINIPKKRNYKWKFREFYVGDNIYKIMSSRIKRIFKEVIQWRDPFGDGLYTFDDKTIQAIWFTKKKLMVMYFELKSSYIFNTDNELYKYTPKHPEPPMKRGVTMLYVVEEDTMNHVEGFIVSEKKIEVAPKKKFSY